MRELEVLVGLATKSTQRVNASCVPVSPGSSATDRRFAHSDLHRRALQAARQAVLAMRASDEIGDDAFHQMEEELDWIEMSGGGEEDSG